MAADLYAACDPYGVSDALTEAELAPLRRLRNVLDAEVKPLLAEYWEAGESPTRSCRTWSGSTSWRPPS